MQRAVRACVEPELLHGVEAWYPGLSSPRWSQPTKEGSSGIQQLLRKMNKSLHNSMRAVLPVWRTTPIAALHRESGISPIAQLLETRRMRFAARLKRLDEAHPLARRTLQPKPPTIHRSIKLKYQMPREAFRTRLRRSDQLLPRSTRPLLLPRRLDEHATPLQTASKDDSAEDFLEWLRSIPSETLVVYSDGSLSTEKAAGYGYVIHRDGHTLTTGNGRLGPAEVFDAEAKGALEGLRAALNLPSPRRILVCLDNLGAATCLRGMPADSSQEVLLEFQALATTHGAVEVRWIPGHTNIAGNEQADALAKAATSLPEPADALPTLAHLRRAARQQPRDAFEAWWDASAPDQYKPLHLKPAIGCPPELELPRPMLHHLLAARSRHGDFADYHEIQPRRRAADMLMWPTKRAKPSLLLPKDPAAPSDEAGTLTDCGSQSCNRQRLRQVRQAGEGKLVLRMGVSSPLGG